MGKPNFFIIGAPRCATTALQSYLRQHPQIFMPRLKECHFFADDFAAFRRVDDLDGYLELFRDSGPQHLAVGEASVYYATSTVAIGRIHRFDQSAKLIMMVRNPVDVVHSLHENLLGTFQEDVTDFETAWRLQPKRRRGEEMPASCQLPGCLQYAQVGRLGGQLQRVLQVFPREQVHVLLFEDFVSDTRRAYESTLEFLGVASDGRSSFPRINENRIATIKWLARLNRRPPASIRKLKETVRSAIGEQGYSRIAQFYLNLLSSKRERVALSDELREELLEEFREDIGLLSEILHRDLSHWLPAQARLV